MAQTATLALTLSTFVSLIYLYKYFKIRKKEVWKEVKTSKYNIRIDDDSMGFRWLDICDDCAEEFIKLLDNFLGSDEGGGGI